MAYRLLALDVDGTLLDPSGVLRPAVQEAVAAAQACGLRVTLCTGRRFRTALPIAQALNVHEPLVVHNGALLKDPISGDTIQRCYLPADIYHQGLAFLRQLSTPMVYVDAFHEHVDILTGALEQAHPFQREYLEQNLDHCHVDTDIDAPPVHGVVMMSIMAEAPRLHTLRTTAMAAFGERARMNILANKNYQGSILEILHPHASKWYGLAHFAAQAGIAPEEIIAVGDDHNDVEMLRHAGLGIAMGNAVPAAQEAADHVTGSNAEDGLAQAIDRFVLQK